MVVWRWAAILLALSLVLSGAVRADESRRGVDGPASARLASAPAPRIVAAYAANVRASGQLIVTFHADPGGCDVTSECDVQSGTLTWTPPSTGALEVLDVGSRGRPRLQALLDLSGFGQPPGSASVERTVPGGTATCIDTTRPSDDARLRVTDDMAGGLTFGLYGAHSPLPLLGVPQTPFDLAYWLEGSGRVADEPAPTRCGGPLPSDFLPTLPTRTVPLAVLRGKATTLDLSGAATFAAGGLAGTARSSIVLHVGRLGGRTLQTKPRPTPRSDEDRVITIQYRVAKVAGSVRVNLASAPSTCAGFGACGLNGTLTLQPGPGLGKAYVIAYDLASTSESRLRRAIGLAPGKIPQYAQVSGLAVWTSETGTLSAALARSGTPACSDLVPQPVSALEIKVNGKRATAMFGGPESAELVPTRDFLRTRCPGPIASDVVAHASALATIDLPVTALGRRILTLHFTRGATVRAPGFTWRSQPLLTIVLRRTGVTERLVPSSAFQT